jgi:hypothetical protein
MSIVDTERDAESYHRSALARSVVLIVFGGVRCEAPHTVDVIDRIGSLAAARGDHDVEESAVPHAVHVFAY